MRKFGLAAYVPPYVEAIMNQKARRFLPRVLAIGCDDGEVGEDAQYGGSVEGSVGGFVLLTDLLKDIENFFK